MQCSRCGRETARNRALCADCYAQGYGDGVSQLEDMLERRRQNSWRETWRHVSKPAIALTLCIVAFFVFTRPARPFPMPNVNLTPTSRLSYYEQDPCAGKERCLVAYLATWCPACHGATGFIKGLNTYLAKNYRVGLKVIIGGGDQSEIKEMARQIGIAAFMDDEGKFAAKLGGFGVPHWWLVDNKGMAIRQSSGSHAEFNDTTRKEFAERVLGADAALFFPK